MNNATASGRRIVAYTDHDGRSKLWPDTSAKVIVFDSVPGLQASLIWATSEPKLERGIVADPVRDIVSLHPEPGGTNFMMMTIPPDSVYESPEFDPGAAGEEQLRKLPGVADKMEPDAPGFHTTDTIDYAILLSGEIVLEVDEEAIALRAGDSVVQLGGRHAWRNRSGAPAVMIFIVMGATRS